MNKNDLINAVAATGLTKVDSAQAVDAMLTAVVNSLKAGEDVRLVDFGTFSVNRRKATEGRNPRTGEKINIAASNVVKFKVGKGLKDAVN